MQSKAPFIARQNGLKAHIAQLAQRVAALHVDSAAVRFRYDSLQTWWLTHAPVLNDTAGRRLFATACQDVITNCERRGAAWHAIADSNKAGWDAALVRLNHSDSLVTAGVGVTECHLIHVGPIKAFGCPSRTTAFKVGAVLGIGLVEGVRIILGKP